MLRAIPRYLLLLLLLGMGGLYILEGWAIAGLGGSWYYVICGVLLVVGGLLWIRGHAIGIGVLAAAVFYTLVWSLIETGLDFWQVGMRCVWICLLCVALVFDGSNAGRGPGGGPARLAMAGALGLVIVATLASYLVLVDELSVDASEFELRERTVNAAPYGRTDWVAYGNSRAGTRYSPLDEIDTSNVSGLEVAWTFRTGRGGSFKNTPQQVGDQLFVCGGGNVLIALDAENGTERWRFDAEIDPAQMEMLTYFTTTCRGISYFEAPPEYAGQCPRRLLMGTTDARLLAVDAETGAPCTEFGDGGAVDLTHKLGEFRSRFSYFVTSSPAIVAGNAVVGGWVLDNVAVQQPSGVIRAFDAITGEFAWAWDMGRPGDPGEPPGEEIFTRATPNMWSLFSVDEARGLVFAPLGNETPDFFGGQRHEASEEFASSVVALDGATGALRWSFQTTHHDIWDLDVPSQPSLVDVPDGQGNLVPAVVQATKRGEVFLLHRETGEPLAPVEERPVVQGAVPEDWTSPTQPYSTLPNPLRDPLTEQRMWGLLPTDQLACRKRFLQARYDGDFTPPGTDESILYAGFAGGYNWGSVAVDERNHIMVGPIMTMANILRLVPRDEVPENDWSVAPQSGTPYGVDTSFFTSPIGVPCTEPPFGMLVAIDLQHQTLLWQRPIGAALLEIGTPVSAGNIITAGGLVLQSGALDGYLRALDVRTGEEISRFSLPHAAHSTPMTYRAPRSGQQTVIVTVPEHSMFGGGGRGATATGEGGYVIAYRLPTGA